MSFALNLTYDDLGIRRAMSSLAAFPGDLKDEVMTPVGQTLETTTVERFDTSTNPDGEAWEESLRVKLFGGKTLLQTGLHIRDTIHFVAETDAVEIGTASAIAAMHNFGGIIHAKTGAGLNFTLADGLGVTVDSVEIPERQFVGMSAEDGRLVVGIAEAALHRAYNPGARA